MLKRSTTFAVFTAGKEAGSFEVSAGTIVNLIDVVPDKNIRAESNGSQTTVPADNTDLISCVVAGLSLIELTTSQQATNCA